MRRQIVIATLVVHAGLAWADPPLPEPDGPPPPPCKCDGDCAPHGLSFCNEGICRNYGAGTPCPPCTAPMQECDGGCHWLSGSDLHCGACSNACAEGFVCTDGVCACPFSQTDCAGECVDTRYSFANCGTCGNVCPKHTSCVEGSCHCPFTACPVAGCVDTATDRQNCGHCGVVCAPGQRCADAKCVPKSIPDLGTRSEAGADRDAAAARDAATDGGADAAGDDAGGDAAPHQGGCTCSMRAVGSDVPIVLLAIATLTLLAPRRQRSRSARFGSSSLAP